MPAEAVEIPEGTLVRETITFDGGIDAQHAFTDQKGKIVYMRNMIPTQYRGGVNGRNGFSIVSNVHATDAALSAGVFYKVGSVARILVHTTGGRVRASSDPFTVWADVGTGFSLSKPFRFVTWLGKVYFINQTDGLRSWDGTTLAAIAAAPKGSTLRVWKDTMFVTGVSGNEDRIYSSAAGDPTTWPAANFVDIGKGDGDRFTALADDGTALICFKRRSHFIIYDPATLANRPVDNQKGSPGQESIVSVDGNIFFMSVIGPCRYLGDAPAELLSPEKLSYMFPSLDSLSNFYVDDEHYYRGYGFSVNGAVGWWLVNGKCLMFYVRREEKPWIILDSTPDYPIFLPVVVDKQVGVVSVFVPKLYGIPLNASPLDFMNLSNTGPAVGDSINGATYAQTMEIHTRTLDFDTPVHFKQLKRVIVTGYMGSVSMEVRPDLEASGEAADMTVQLTGVGLAPTTLLTKAFDIPEELVARGFNFRFTGGLGERVVGSPDASTFQVAHYTPIMTRVVVEAVIRGTAD